MSVEIGKHWRPTHAVVRDAHTGFYSERYPLLGPSPTSTELRVQHALLTKPTTLRERLFGSKT